MNWTPALARRASAATRGSGSPDPLIPPDNFSARWTRTLDFAGRMYRFSIQGDDGMRVFVDDQIIIDEGHPAATVPPAYTMDVNITAGLHELRVEYYEAQLDAFIHFTYGPLP